MFYIYFFGIAIMNEARKTNNLKEKRIRHCSSCCIEFSTIPPSFYCTSEIA